ncbi:MAG: phosphatase PAP2 family protein [Ginsengibacter sp.]
MALSSLFKQNRCFFISYLVAFIFAVWILLSYSKSDGFILLNPWHSQPFDYLFIPLTYLGDGIFSIALALPLFFRKRKALALMIVSSFLISGIIAQIIKIVVVAPRPAVFFEYSHYPNFIEGVTLYNLHSFPSGHTTSIFALAATLAFFLKNKSFSILLLLVAILVGYSRIYLGQHFMEDVLSGSVIGITTSIFCEIFFLTYFKKLDQNKINKSSI